MNNPLNIKFNYKRQILNILNVEYFHELLMEFGRLYYTIF